MAHTSIIEYEQGSNLEVIAAQKVTMSLLPYTCSIPSCSFGCFTERGLKAHTTMKHTKPGNIGNQNARTITKMKASEWETMGVKKFNQSEEVIKPGETEKNASSQIRQIPSNAKPVKTGTKRKITKLNASEWAKMGIGPKNGETKDTSESFSQSKKNDLENSENSENNQDQEGTVTKKGKIKIVSDDILIKQEPESETSGSEVQNFHKNKTEQYACDKCTFRGKQKSHLVDHVKSAHEGVRYSCDHCSYKATTKSSLYRHERRKHNNILV